MAAFVRISRKPTPGQIADIVAKASKGDVTVVCPVASSPAGRKLMRQRLCHAGLPPTIAAVLGWANAAPGDDVVPEPVAVITRIEGTPMRELDLPAKAPHFERFADDDAPMDDFVEAPPVPRSGKRRG